MDAAGYVYDNVEYNVSSNESDVAFLGELNLGVQYTRCCWTLYGGYRAMAVCGVALTGNQLPQDYRDLASVTQVDTNGCLILHGANFGIERCW